MRTSLGLHGTMASVLLDEFDTFWCGMASYNVQPLRAVKACGPHDLRSGTAIESESNEPADESTVVGRTSEVAFEFGIDID